MIMHYIVSQLMLTWAELKKNPGGGGSGGPMVTCVYSGRGRGWGGVRRYLLGIFLLNFICKFKEFCFNFAGDARICTPSSCPCHPYLSRSAHGSNILLHFLDFKGHILIFVIKYISDTGKLSFHGNCTNELHMLLNQCLKFVIVLAIIEKEIFSGHILLIGTVQ